MNMTSKERVLAALNHETPDRIPWGEHFIDYNVFEDLLGRKSLMHAKFAETQALWEGRRDEVVAHYKRDLPELVRVLEMDLVTVHKVPARGYRPDPMEDLGNGNYRDQTGNLHRLSSVTHDLMQVPVNTSFFARDVTLEEVEDMVRKVDAGEDDMARSDPSEYEWADHVVKEMGETHFIIMACNGLEWPRFGTTEEDGWMNLATDPEICAKIAELQAKQTLRELQRIAKTGVDGILSVGDLGSSTGMLASPQLYREIILPWHIRIYEEAKRLGLHVLRHCCGHVWPIIDELAKYNDAYEGIQASAGMDIAELKRRVGDQLCLWGGILHENIHGGTPEDIRADARYAFENAARGGGFIMGSSHSLAVGAKRENIMEMKKCRDEWHS